MRLYSTFYFDIFLFLTSNLIYSYNPYMKPYSLDFRVNANSEICMYLVPFFLISNLAGLQCTFYNIGPFRSRMMWGSSRFAVRNSKKVPDQLLVCGLGDL